MKRESKESNGKQATPTTGPAQKNRNLRTQVNAPQQTGVPAEPQNPNAPVQSNANSAFPFPQVPLPLLPFFFPFPQTHDQAISGPEAKKQKLEKDALTAKKVELEKTLRDLEKKQQSTQESSDRYKSQIQGASSKILEYANKASKLEKLVHQKNNEIKSLEDEVKHYRQKYGNYKEMNFQLLDEVKSYREQRNKANEKMAEYKKDIRALQVELQKEKDKSESSNESTLDSDSHDVKKVNRRFSSGVQQEKLENVSESIKSSRGFSPDPHLNETEHLSAAGNFNKAKRASSFTDIKTDPVQSNDQEVDGSNQSMLSPLPSRLPSVVNSPSQASLSNDRETQIVPKTLQNIEDILNLISDDED